MPRIAVIDTGHVGKTHAVTVTVHPQARPMLVCDPFIEATKALVEPLGVRTSAGATEAFSTDDADMVVTGSPTLLRTERVLTIVRAGRAALCEKPAVSSAKAARALADESATFEHPPVMAGSQRRYDPSITKARRPAAEGRIGRIEQLTIVSHDPALLSAEYLAQSGGVFKDMTIHDFDKARFFLGEIISVNAIGQELDPALADVDGFDGTVITLRAVSGAVVIIKNTRHCASDYDQEVEVSGSGGEVITENLRATSVQVNDATGLAQQEVYLGFFLGRHVDAYRDELTASIDAVNNDSPVTPTVESGVATLVLAEAAEYSARDGQIVEVTK